MTRFCPNYNTLKIQVNNESNGRECWEAEFIAMASGANVLHEVYEVSIDDGIKYSMVDSHLRIEDSSDYATGRAQHACQRIKHAVIMVEQHCNLVRTDLTPCLL